ncbi:hypothetical protein N7535_007831 [Penicillium sp. DV-2018c]|nr:hypothetical protein N7535_007831 [Penicillium sp. DV-2018c]
MEPTETSQNGLRSPPSSEDASRPNRAIEVLRLRQRGHPPPLLPSPPDTSPLSAWYEASRSPFRDLPLLYSPMQPRGLTFNGSSDPRSFYDPIRGALSRVGSNPNRSYRDRSESSYDAGEPERDRSRSPRLSDQEYRLPEGEVMRGAQWTPINDFRREPYAPPQLPRLDVPSSPPDIYASRGNENHGSQSREPEGVSSPFNRSSPLGMNHSQGLVRKSESQDAQELAQEGASNEEEEGQLCEFAAPCRMHPSPDGMHYRKVVSHVFGRNKAVTKLFPLSVWVHYCRKHYQRARYRADQWPFTQCDLLVESLDRMERWNGVLHFELILRRREQLRIRHDSAGPASGEADDENDQEPTAVNSHDSATETNSRTPGARGRKHPTAIIAPVPDWLRRHVGAGKSFDEIREIIELIRRHMSQLREQELAQQEENSRRPSFPWSPRGRPSPRPSKSGRNSKGANRQFARHRATNVRFPDIEILPHFKPWVKAAAIRQRSAGASASKESESGEPAPPLAHREDRSGDGHGDGGLQYTHVHYASSDSGALAGADVIPRSSAYVHPDPTSARHQRPAYRPSANSRVAGTPMTERRAQAEIGRAGTNRGQSASQRRRNERVYLKALDRGSGNGNERKRPERDGR